MPTQSAYERILAEEQAKQSPANSIANIYQAYKSGQMTPEQKSDFEHDVKTGAVMLPQGFALDGEHIAGSTEKPVPVMLPVSVTEAYAYGKMTEQQRNDLEHDMKAGLVQLPPLPNSPLEVPNTAQQGVIEQPKEPSLGDKLRGGAEAAGLAAGGIIGGTPGMVHGFLQGTAQELSSGQFGTQESADRIEEEAARQAGKGAAFFHGGVSPTGQQYAQNVGDVMSTLNPVMGAPAEMAQLGASVRAGMPAVNAVRNIATAPIARAAESVQPAVVNAVRQTTPAGLREAEAANIPVLTSDIFPPKTQVGSWAVGTGERIPFAGTGPIRAAQQEARVTAVKDLLNEHDASNVADASDNVIKDILGKRSADLEKYSSMKKEVISRLSSEQSSPVPVPKTVAAVDKAIEKLNSLKTAELEPVVAKLEDWKNAVQGQNLENIEQLRGQIGESFKSAEMSSVRSKAEAALSGIYGPLKNDMADFIKTNGEPKDFIKWSVANKRLSLMAGDLKNSGMKSIINRGEATPEIIQNMLFSKRPSDSRKLYAALTPAGRENAKRAILAKVAQDSGGIDDLSTAKFATNLKKMAAPIGVMFKGEDLARVQGLARALKLTRRAELASLNPQTGAQLAIPVGAAVLADIFGSGGAAVVSGAGIGGLARLYESAPIRNVLIKISKSTPASNEESRLVGQLNTEIQSALGNPARNQTEQ